MKITKYFSKDVLKFIEEGSFRFGTLESYRAVEAQELHRMSDQREGLIQTALHPESDHISLWQLPNGTVLENCTFINCGVPVMLENEVNDFIFCASIGCYDQDHHLEMVEKNPDLTHYAVLDLEKFLKGLRFSAPHQYTFKHHTYEPWLRWRQVTYESPISHYQLPSVFDLSNYQNTTSDHYTKTVFSKDLTFAHEKEFRIVIRPYVPDFVPFDAPPLNLKHRKLREAIITCGYL